MLRILRDFLMKEVRLRLRAGVRVGVRVRVKFPLTPTLTLTLTSTLFKAGRVMTLFRRCGTLRG